MECIPTQSTAARSAAPPERNTMIRARNSTVLALLLAAGAAHAQCGVEKFVHTPRTFGDGTGGKVALSGDTLMVASNTATNVRGPGAGGVMVFTRSGAPWVQGPTLTAADGAASDNFGR